MTHWQNCFSIVCFSKFFSMRRQQLLKKSQGEHTVVNEPEQLNVFKYLSWVIPSPFFLTNMPSKTPVMKTLAWGGG